MNVTKRQPQLSSPKKHRHGLCDARVRIQLKTDDQSDRMDGFMINCERCQHDQTLHFRLDDGRRRRREVSHKRCVRLGSIHTTQTDTQFTY